MKCVLCKENLDTESPYVVYRQNPETFRKAWMHNFCFDHAYDWLRNEDPSNELLYKDRQDEYITRFS